MKTFLLVLVFLLCLQMEGGAQRETIFSDWSSDLCPPAQLSSLLVQWDPTPTPQQLAIPDQGTSVTWTLTGYMVRLTLANSAVTNTVMTETSTSLAVSPASNVCVAVRSYGTIGSATPTTPIAPVGLRVVGQ